MAGTVKNVFSRGKTYWRKLGFRVFGSPCPGLLKLDSIVDLCWGGDVWPGRGSLSSHCCHLLAFLHSSCGIKSFGNLCQNWYFSGEYYGACFNLGLMSSDNVFKFWVPQPEFPHGSPVQFPLCCLLKTCSPPSEKTRFLGGLVWRRGRADSVFSFFLVSYYLYFCCRPELSRSLKSC